MTCANDPDRTFQAFLTFGLSAVSTTAILVGWPCIGTTAGLLRRSPLITRCCPRSCVGSGVTTTPQMADAESTAAIATFTVVSPVLTNDETMAVSATPPLYVGAPRSSKRAPYLSERIRPNGFRQRKDLLLFRRCQGVELMVRSEEGMKACAMQRMKALVSCVNDRPHRLHNVVANRKP